LLLCHQFLLRFDESFLLLHLLHLHLGRHPLRLGGCFCTGTALSFDFGPFRLALPFCLLHLALLWGLEHTLFWLFG
jgi:hypothetical protein